MPEEQGLQKGKDKKLPIQKLLDGGYLRVVRLHKDLNDLSPVPHRHDHYELMLVTEGVGHHSINFKTFDVQPNRLYFLHPGQVHIIDHFDRNGWLVMFGEELFQRFLSIHRHEDEQGLLDSYSAHPFVDLNEHLQHIVSFIIGRLDEELKSEAPNYQLMLHYVSLLLLHANKAHIVQHPKKTAKALYSKIFHELKQEIEHSFKQQHLAAFYADKLRMDIKKLNLVCRDFTKLSVAGLLQERLLTESKILLQTSSKSVKEISYELGFNDPAFFGRFFKRATGITPASFRNSRL